MLYLHDENNLLVSVVPRDLTGGEMCLTYISIRANYNMTGKELLDLALETWNLKDNGREYGLVTIRPEGEVSVPLEQNIIEFGLHNGSPLQIVAC
jgi:hypothetical protein